MNDLTHFSLFSGIGGIDLASEWAGFRTVGQCEFAEYPTKVLEKHWPDVPRWKDVRDVTVGSVREKGIEHITVLSGGFPCQPVSHAGKRKGKEDDRFLWPEMFRVVSELRPSWVIGENVTGLRTMGLDQTLIDLESIGYTTRSFNIPACSVNADHERKRLFIVAYSQHNGLFNSEKPEGTGTRTGTPAREDGTKQPSGSSCLQGRITDVAHPYNPGLQGSEQYRTYTPGDRKRNPCTFRTIAKRNIISDRRKRFTEPHMDRMVDGVPKRVDRLKCLGNAVVPQQVYPILKAIADIEKMGINY